MNDVWYVYIIRCKDGELYTGIAKDIFKRVEVHNKGLACRYTKYRRSVTLIYGELHKSRRDAVKRGVELKGFTRRKKLEIARNFKKEYCS